MIVYASVSSRELSTFTTEQIRQHFLIEGLFKPNELTLNYLEDRMIVGGAMPTNQPILIQDLNFFKDGYFLEHRELAMFNLGGIARIEVDNTNFSLDRHSTLYIGRGHRLVKVYAQDLNNPPKLYLVSTVAEVQHPNTLVHLSDITPMKLGSQLDCNTRLLYKIIHPAGIKSSRLMLGITLLEPGNVWNTMPPHTHMKRMESYMYFNLPAHHTVVHLLGEPHATRHVMVQNEQVVISPNYSIHSGVGTQNYAFVWAMSGENQSFDDMQKVTPESLK